VLSSDRPRYKAESAEPREVNSIVRPQLAILAALSPETCTGILGKEAKKKKRISTKDTFHSYNKN
jgi:acetyl-CoA carboxylase alpha subunit